MILAKQDDGQQHRRHLVHVALDDTRREARLLHRNLRLLRRHEASGWKAGDQRSLADGLAVMSRHPDETLQQRIVDFFGERQGLRIGSGVDRRVGARGIVFHDV